FVGRHLYKRPSHSSSIGLSKLTFLSQKWPFFQNQPLQQPAGLQYTVVQYFQELQFHLLKQVPHILDKNQTHRRGYPHPDIWLLIHLTSRLDGYGPETCCIGQKSTGQSCHLYGRKQSALPYVNNLDCLLLISPLSRPPKHFQNASYFQFHRLTIGKLGLNQSRNNNVG